ncbi:ribokinase [Staphylococcus sp. 17KM0847]|uniref:ribokinase n=1 Tax=Staphylococcus sp. 17KM0847 TaxID=2583989 RepID=UPI0015DCA215|nr:ribokinase [Staphylococcus sp. 17KM0847]QLK86541.1 ribokinase [Staphylococcus sp. 17KM0847]
MNKHIIVIGSASMDLTVCTDALPEQGETILGTSFFMAPGGKGANQAVSAAKLAKTQEVYMIGAVGQDAFGQEILTNLRQYDVNTSHVQVVKGEHSGTAHITLYDQDNRIVVVPAANNAITPEIVVPLLTRFDKGDIVVMQQEIPSNTVEAVIEKAVELGLKVILNPAPYRAIDAKLLDKVTYLTPNEYECQKLFGKPWDEAIKDYPNQLIVTLGEKGVAYYDQNKHIIPAYQCKAIDTTGAGDTFNGAFAVALSEEKTLSEALYFANMASCFAVSKLGAQGGIPTREEVDQALK